MNATADKLVKPCHIIRIDNNFNDVHLPKLSVDLENLSVRFDWKELFSLFFSEAKCVRTAWVSQHRSPLVQPLTDWQVHSPVWQRLYHGYVQVRRETKREYVSRLSKGFNDEYRRGMKRAVTETKFARRRRIGRLHQLLFAKPLALDANYIHLEKCTMQWMDQCRELRESRLRP